MKAHNEYIEESTFCWHSHGNSSMTLSGSSMSSGTLDHYTTIKQTCARGSTIHGRKNGAMKTPAGHIQPNKQCMLFRK
jgi:hypothetical protein